MKLCYNAFPTWADIIILENESSSNGIKLKRYADMYQYVVDVAS